MLINISCIPVTNGTTTIAITTTTTKTSIAIISIGTAFGAFVLLIIIAGVITCIVLKRRKQMKQSDQKAYNNIEVSNQSYTPDDDEENNEVYCNAEIVEIIQKHKKLNTPAPCTLPSNVYLHEPTPPVIPRNTLPSDQNVHKVKTFDDTPPARPRKPEKSKSNQNINKVKTFNDTPPARPPKLQKNKSNWNISV